MSARRNAILWTPPVLYAAALYAASAQSRIPGFVESVWDKALHAGAWMGLAFLVLRAIHGGRYPLRAWPSVIAVLICLGYGFSDELHQAHVPGRDASLLDVLADGVGALMALAAALAWYRLSGRRSRRVSAA